MENYKELYDQAVKKLKDLNKKIEEFQKTQQDWETQKNQLQQELKDSKNQLQRTGQDWQNEYSELRLKMDSQLQKEFKNNKNQLQQVSQDLEKKKEELKEIVNNANKKYGEMDTLEKKRQKEFEELQKKITKAKSQLDHHLDESSKLVRNQTREALARIFEDQANKHQQRSKFAAVVFYIAVILLVVAIGFFINALLFKKLTIDLSIYSLYPLFSIAAFAFGYLVVRLNKTISEETRLFAEYTHKHSLAKAYTAYKEQAGADQELQQKLLSDLTGAIAKNPVRLLSKDKSKANTPTEAISDSIKKKMNSTQNNK